MALQVKDAGNTTVTVKSTEKVAGVHHPHHLVDDAFLLRVARSKVSNFSLVHVYGRGSVGLDTFEDLALAGDSHPWQTAATTLSISSSSAFDHAVSTGAVTLYISGLSSAYAEQSESVTLQGTSTVVSSNSYLRVNKVYVASVGSGGTNAGQIEVLYESAVPAAVIPASEGSAFMGFYSVPAGYTAFLLDLHADTESQSDTLEVALFSRVTGVGTYGIFIRRAQLHLDGAGSYQRRFSNYDVTFPAQSDIVLRGRKRSGSGEADLSAAISLLLVSNSEP